MSPADYISALNFHSRSSYLEPAVLYITDRIRPTTPNWVASSTHIVVNPITYRLLALTVQHTIGRLAQHRTAIHHWSNYVLAERVMAAYSRHRDFCVHPYYTSIYCQHETSRTISIVV